MVCQEVVAGTWKGIGVVIRGDARTSQGKQKGGATTGSVTTRWHVKRQKRIKWLQHDKKQRNNQPADWEATAH
jgi:hypothetical protein